MSRRRRGLMYVIVITAIVILSASAMFPTRIHPISSFLPVSNPARFDHSDFDKVLTRFVNDEGEVDYHGLKEDSRDLDRYYALITDKYVHDEDDFPAGSAAVALFAAVKKKGWHEVRLVDATGKPIKEKNSPHDDFEREAVKALKSGAPYLEQIIVNNGTRHLRAATPVPVVRKKCILCHAHYEEKLSHAQLKAGERLVVRNDVNRLA